MESNQYDLSSLLRHELDKVSQIVYTSVQTHVPLISTISEYLLRLSGKRLRPLLTIASQRLFDDSNDRCIPLAAAVECIHTATLLHDDVVDHSTTRRGQKTANIVFGNQACILVGDYLFTRAFKLMLLDDDYRVLKILADASSQIAEGEVWQLDRSSDLSISLNELISIAESKTATLFSAACEVGSMVANQPKEITDHMKNYGLNLGILFQLTDDILDYFGNPQTWTKNLGDDLNEKKVTFPVIFLYEKANLIEKKYLKKLYERRYHPTPTDFENVIQMMNDHEILKQSKAFAQFYAEKSLFHINSIQSNSPLKACLIDLVDYCINRGY
jgi:octaprenyl-diphosphate synthase